MDFLIILLLCSLATSKVTLQSRFGKRKSATASDNILFNATVFLTASLLFCLDIPKASAGTWGFASVFALFTVAFQLFYTKALSVGNVSLTVMIVNLSMIFPSFVSVIFYNESLTAMRLLGILFTILSFVLAVDFKIKGKLSHSWLLFATIATLANGGIGITQKIFGASVLIGEKKSFVACAYAIAFVVTLFLRLCMRSTNIGVTTKQARSNCILAIAVGIILALFQWLNTYAISIMDGSFLFPVYSGGSIILSTIVGVLFFKDKLEKRQIISIALGVIAVVIMNIS